MSTFLLRRPVDWSLLTNVRSKANYNSYVDHRRKYLTDLFNYILSLGFSI